MTFRESPELQYSIEDIMEVFSMLFTRFSIAFFSIYVNVYKLPFLLYALTCSFIAYTEASSPFQ